ncbi:DUF2867 domain-containing protein [Shimia sp.]|uniref:DUF2867 domain-containing protein n=1 Tax=Shimia sp. TaxID=1954381 RepID=UPI00329A179F
MSRIQKLSLPKTSQLWQHVQPGDFIDGYAVESTLSPERAIEVGLSMPIWAKALLKIRNTIMKPLGVKTESKSFGEGAIFPCTYQSVDEMLVGTDDKHLNFRICVLRENGLIHMATWVHRNNPLGRIYLAVVMPFHVLIVRDAMRRIARAAA